MFSDQQVMQWHRLWNDNLVFLADVNRKIVAQKRRIEELKGMDRHRERVRTGEVKDRVTQTQVTWKAETNRFVKAPREAVSEFSST